MSASFLGYDRDCTTYLMTQETSLAKLSRNAVGASSPPACERIVDGQEVRVIFSDVRITGIDREWYRPYRYETMPSPCPLPVQGRRETGRGTSN